MAYYKFEEKFKNRNNNNRDKFIANSIRNISYIYILIMVFIFGKILFEGINSINYAFLSETPQNLMKDGGIFPGIFGTFSVALLMILFAVPVGVSAGIYMSEYSDDSIFSKIMRVSVNNLAGVPSIVFGLFGLGFFVLFLGHNIDEILNTGRVFGQPIMLWASATLAILVLPTIIITTIQTLQAIPQSQRMAAYSVGATKWQTIRKIILPQARPGILTGVILAIGRGVGETAPVLFLGCAFFLPDLPVSYLDFGLFTLPMINPAEQFMYLSYHVFVLATQSSNPTETLPMQYATTLVLIFITVAFNIVAILYRHKFRKINSMIS